jgi:hypothetical protein
MIFKNIFAIKIGKKLAKIAKKSVFDSKQS